MWATDPSPAGSAYSPSAARFAIVALLTSLQAVAQPAPVITDEDLARVRRETPTVTDDDVHRVQQRYAVPPPEVGTVATPRIEALPKPLTDAMPNLGDIAQGYAQGNAPMLGSGPGLFIFVSLSMPEATLARLVDQAGRAKATILIRGFAKGSLRETVTRLQKLIGQREVAVLIDPQAFDRYAVKRVPTFVLARDGNRPASCAGGTCPPPGDFVSAAGDVSLDYALDQLRRAAPGFEAEAGVFLTRLRP